MSNNPPSKETSLVSEETQKKNPSVPIAEVTEQVSNPVLIGVSGEQPITSGSDVFFKTEFIPTAGLVTIPMNINLYYGSQTKNNFDPNAIKLSDGTLLAIFSNNSNLSQDFFMNCANFPISNGYLHKFVVKKAIPNIKLISKSSIDKNTTLKKLDYQYCQHMSEPPRLNGFAYAIKNIDITKISQENVYDYIIGICDPNEYLDYVSTRICVNPYRLSDPIEGLVNG